MIGVASAAPSAPTRHAVPGPAVASRRGGRESGLADLVLAARLGDDRAWAALVDRLEPTMRRAASAYRLQPADVDDVVQATWMQLFESLDRLREPAAVAGWLATATRRTALRLLQPRTREHLSDEVEAGEASETERPEQRLLAAERREALARGIAALPDRHRRLMRVLMADADLGYDAIAELVAMPTGSIGPIRGRCLDRLRRDAGLRALRAADAPAWRSA